MTNGSAASNRVVDLLLYKAARRQRRLDFDHEATAIAAPALAPVVPFRPLTEAAIRHREQMLKHLANTR